MQNLSQVVNLFHHENKQKLFPEHESYTYSYINTARSRQKYDVLKPYMCSFPSVLKVSKRSLAGCIDCIEKESNWKATKARRVQSHPSFPTKNVTNSQNFSPQIRKRQLSKTSRRQRLVHGQRAQWTRGEFLNILASRKQKQYPASQCV